MKLQKLGGYAAIATVCLCIAYLMYGSLLQNRFGDMNDPAKAITAVAAAPADFYALNIVYIFANLLAMIFVFALHDRLKDKVPHLARIMLIGASVGTSLYMAGTMMYINSIAMIVPVKDASAYRAMDVTIAGMNSLGDHAWGWVYLLIGCAVLKTRAFSRILGWLSILVGILWLPWFILSQFGFELIASFSVAPFAISTIWLGIALLRQELPQPGSRS